MTASQRRLLASEVIKMAETLLKQFNVPVAIKAGPVRVDLKPETDTE